MDEMISDAELGIENEEKEAMPCDELEELRQKNEELTRALEERRNFSQRLEGEIEDFSEMFPDVPLAEIPDEIWAEVKGGLPLSAAYARHERRLALTKKHTETVNEAAREGSSGALGARTEYYYSPDEVRKMTASEVKKNYSHIISSMKHWN